MTGSDERAIGRLEGKIDLMLAEQEKAAQSRRQTYEKLETLGRKIDATDTKVEGKRCSQATALSSGLAM